MLLLFISPLSERLEMKIKSESKIYKPPIT